MNEKPKFEILEQIGHGQFSNVFKARWINAPLTPTRASSLNRSNIQLDPNHHQQPMVTNNQKQQQQKFSPLEQLNNFSNLCQQQPVTGDKYVALKRIKFYDIQDSKLRMDCVKEVKLLQQLKHPNIINYSISFIERNELFIVLELADGGDLSKLIKYFQKRNQLLNERIILKYFTQVCSAVDYIHSKRILHRDIKPANIFMTSNGCVKLGDFGLGRFFSQNTHDAFSIVGTFYYMSPERIRKSGYGFSSDIWSLGCVLYELITLNSPFSIMILEQQYNNNNDNNNNGGGIERRNQYNLQWLIERIVRAEYPSLANYNEISPRLRQLTADCLQPNPETRPNMEYICAVVGEAYRLQQLSASASNSPAPSSNSTPASSRRNSSSIAANQTITTNTSTSNHNKPLSCRP